jgi:hypothetical protein
METGRPRCGAESLAGGLGRNERPGACRWGCGMALLLCRRDRFPPEIIEHVIWLRQAAAGYSSRPRARRYVRGLRPAARPDVQ